MTFTLNGQSVAVPPSMLEDRVLWILRDHFALNGPKYGCGVGVCGACVVHVDGRAERACGLRGQDIVGAAVTTLEGLGKDRSEGLHPVQRAWIEHSVPQCGYCQNGQIMTAAALLANKPAATAGDISEAMDAVTCRCGTQHRIRKAVVRAQVLIKEGA